MQTPSFPGDVELAGGILALILFGYAGKLINGSVAGWQLWAFFVLGAATVISAKILNRNNDNHKKKR